MSVRGATTSLIVAVLAITSACGDDGPRRADPPGTPDAPRVVEVTMYDLGFDPGSIDVTVGETVDFVFVNTGSLPHEAVFGDEEMQAEHEVEMANMSGEMGVHDMDMSGGADDHEMDMSGGADDHEMDMSGGADDHEMDDHDTGMAGEHAGGHDEGVVAVSVEPGRTEHVLMTFGEAGAMVIGCHVPGHWDAGMRVDVAVS